MFEVRWTQQGSTVIIRNLHEALGFGESAVSMAIKDLMYCIAYNEDYRSAKIDFSKPLHLDVQYEYWSESVVYSSNNRKTTLNDNSFVLGGSLHSFFSFYQSHILEWETRQFLKRDVLIDSSPLTKLFHWWYMSGDPIVSNFFFDREYLYSSDVRSIVHLKSNNLGYVDINEITRGNHSLYDFKIETPGFFLVLLKPIEGMHAYSKKNNCCSICETQVVQELEYGYCDTCAKKFLLPISVQPSEIIDYGGLRTSPLVDKSEFYFGNDYEYWVRPDGRLGSRDTGLPF